MVPAMPTRLSKAFAMNQSTATGRSRIARIARDEWFLGVGALTSLAFLRFGDEEAFIARAEPPDVEAYYLQELLPRKLDIELDYVRNWSLQQDLQIVLSTVRALLL